MRYTVLIPARLASSRLPGKPLADIEGVPMVVRVAQRVRSGVHASVRIVVAADSTDIIQACETHGVEAILTDNRHVSGSDRLSQASEILGLASDDIVVNVQGDEPLIDPALVESVAQLLANTQSVAITTAGYPIETIEDFLSQNVVKVVTNSAGIALYFSRAPIPWWRDGSQLAHPTLPYPTPIRHIGIYAYRVSFLRQFPMLPPAPMEATEALEQLRALWHGYQIAVHVIQRAPGPGVDTPADLERVRQIFRNQV